MKRLIKNKYFLALFGSQVSSLLTINLLNFLVIVRIFEQTNSSIASSFIWVAYAIPAIIVGPFAAAAVDILDRRKILVYSNLAQAIIVFLYAFFYSRFLYLSYGVIAVYSLINQLYVPAETAYLTRIVKKEDLMAANSVFFVSQQSATIIAFGLAGFASELLGFKITTIIASMFLFGAALATYFLPKQVAKSSLHGENFEERMIKFLRHMMEGFMFIRRNSVILYPFLFLVWLQVSMSILVVNLPAIATEIVLTKPALAGPLIVLPAGAGAILGTFVVMKLSGRKFRKKTVIQTGLITLSMAFLGVSVLLPLLSFWLGRLVLVSLFLAAGGAFVSTLVPTITFLQEKTPKEMAGRVFGNFWFITTGLTVLPVIFAATLTELLGARSMLLILGIATLIVFIVSEYHIVRKQVFVT